jgi:putative ABC transport system substrate-binding protein
MKRRTFVQVFALAAATRSLFAQAQPAARLWRVGWLYQGSADGGSLNIDTFRAGLKGLGYTEGRDYALIARFAGGRTERLPGLAAELKAIPVDVLVANSTPAVLAAMEATRTIPIVMVAVADPVGSGLVRSFSRPGGNVTGTAWALDELSHKWLGLLKTMRSGLSRVGVMHNSTNPSMNAMLGPLAAVARTLGMTLTLYDFTQQDALTGIFNGWTADRVEGLVVLPDAFIFDHRQRIAQQAIRVGLPSVYAGRRYIEAGGLIGYGPNLFESPRRAASYVDKILKGAKPEELPVERSREFELVINMKTAKTLGLTIPRTLLVQAQHVLE